MFILGQNGSIPQKRVLYVGRTGADVKERQSLLNALNETGNPLGQTNLPELEMDGVFGSETTMRVKEFQGRNRLFVDGIIGPQTDTQMDAIWLEFLQTIPAPANQDGAQN